MRSFIKILLCCVVIIGFCFVYSPTTAQAASSDGYTYQIRGGGAVITDCTLSGDVVIPDMLGGYPVTEIFDRAFQGVKVTSVVIPDTVTTISYCAFNSCQNLTDLTLGSGVTTIESYAFQNCSALTRVTIPGSVDTIGFESFKGCSSLSYVSIEYGVTTIDYGAFRSCSALTELIIPESVTTIDACAFYGCSALAEVTIPESVTVIGNDAFNECSSLTNVTIPNGVTVIDDRLFRNCSSLTSVSIPDSVTAIEYGAFMGCSSLTELSIPCGVTTIGNSVFSDCSNLAHIWVDKSNTVFSSDDCGVLFDKEKTTLLLAPLGFTGSYSVPNGVTNIGASAFWLCRKVTEVIIPDSVTDIGASAFRGCIALTKVTIPGNVISIGSSAFTACSGLTNVTICNGVTSIGANAFSGCNMTSVSIPESVTNISSSAFRGIETLKNIWVDENNTAYCSNDQGHLFDKAMTALLWVPPVFEGSYFIPDSVTSIGSYAFYGCSGLTGVTIPDGVTTIGSNAFYGCSGLTGVTIPDGVTTIGSFTFYGCNSLTSVNIPDGVTAIGSYAFKGCSGLASVIIPESVTTIDFEAFRGCSGLNEVTFRGNMPYYSEEYYYVPPEAYPQVFYGVTATIYYPAGDDTWDRRWILDPIEGELTWVAYEVEETLVEEWNVALGDDLAVNFHLNADEDDQVQVTVGDETVTYTITELEKTEDGKYIVTANVAAAQMTEPITIQLVDGEAVSYTVRQYAEKILEDASHSKYHPLIKEMLNYGGAAQKYFDYDTDEFANEGITDVGMEEVPQIADTEVTVTGDRTDIYFYAASLIHENKTTVRMYFRGSINQSSWNLTEASIGQIGDFTQNPEATQMVIDIEGIEPEDLDKPVELMVTDANGKTMTVSYSPLNYIVRMNEKGSVALKALLKAMYNYHLAAKTLCEE